MIYSSSVLYCTLELHSEVLRIGYTVFHKYFKI